MPKPGDVFKYINYTFEDGSQRDKWFVVLNYCNVDTPCITLKTTSQPQRYQGCIKGCNDTRKCFYVPNTWQACFIVDTYIQLPQIIEFQTIQLLQDGINGKLEQKDPITNDCLTQLKGCLATFKDDISDKHWDLIYKVKI